jgi:hypothetical protein
MVELADSGRPMPAGQPTAVDGPSDDPQMPVTNASGAPPAVADHPGDQTAPPDASASPIAAGSAPPASASARLCGGCGLPLDPGQRDEARYHGNRCRQLAFRARRKAALLACVDIVKVERATVLAALDRVDAALARLHQEIERR